MTTRAQTLIPISIAAVIVGIIGIITIPSDAKLESTEFPIGVIKLDGKIIKVQIADTIPRHARGLMFQDRIDYTQGMFFIFEESKRHNMWMLNVQFPLDIVWFDDEQKIIHIEKNIQICKSALETVTCPSYGPRDKNSSFVLELASGYIDKFKISLDSDLELISI